jgi:SAM-dependent methyltransferase
MQRRSLTLVAIALAATLPCCRKHPASPASPPAAPPTSTARSAFSTVRPASSAAQAHHDPAHPPIECPLAKQGINPAHLRPFEDVEKYIAFLERPDRAAWQRPDALVAALGLKGNETVVDIGAGSGYFAFRFARALPEGSVVAMDVEPEMVRHMHHKAMTEGIHNLHVVLGKPDDPAVPPGANLVFICDVLHHVADRPAWLGKLATEMARGAHLVVVEFKEGPLPQGPPEGAKIPKADLLRLVTGAGLKFDSEKADLLPYQYFLKFSKA